MARKWTGAWSGGRTRLGTNGETVWVIEATRDHVRYSITLDPAKVSSQKQALAELALFERDPVAYKANHTVVSTPTVPVDVPAVTPELVSKFLHARRTDPEEPITEGHAKDLARYLKNWGRRLQGKDLRAITLAEYQAHVEALGLARHHIKHLRAFTKWLRKTGRLSSAQDASRDLAIPQTKHRRAKPDFRAPTIEEVEKIYAAMKSRPGNWVVPSSQYPAEFKERVLAALGEKTYREVAAEFGIPMETVNKWRTKAERGPWMTERQACRDVFALRALTGLHHTEVERIAQGHNDWEVVAVEGQGEIAGVVKVLHKNGLPHPQALPKKALEAAKRLQARGRAPDDKLVAVAIAEAAEAAGVKAFPPTLLRHFFITASAKSGRVVKPVTGGVSREEIAAVVGHGSVKTTFIYDGTEVPSMIALPVKLENDEDP